MSDYIAHICYFTVATLVFAWCICKLLITYTNLTMNALLPAIRFTTLFAWLFFTSMHAYYHTLWSIGYNNITLAMNNSNEMMVVTFILWVLSEWQASRGANRF